MEDISTIIRQITDKKKAENTFPSFALKREIWGEVFRQMEAELEQLAREGKVKKGDTVRDEYFEIC